MTVLFTDLVAFTSQAEQMDPEDVYQPSREPLWLVAAYSTMTVWM